MSDFNLNSSDEETMRRDTDESGSSDDEMEYQDDPVISDTRLTTMLGDISHLDDDQIHGLSILLSVMNEMDEQRETLTSELSDLYESSSNETYSLIDRLWDMHADRDGYIEGELQAEDVYDSLVRLLPHVTCYNLCLEFMSIMDIIDRHSTPAERYGFVVALLGVCLIDEFNCDVFRAIDLVMPNGRFYLDVILEREYTGQLANLPDERMLGTIMTSPSYNQQHVALYRMYATPRLQ